MKPVKELKLEQIEHLLYLLGEANYRYGFPYFNESYRKRKRLFNPKFINTLLIIYLIKSIIALFISDDIYSVIIGDFTSKLSIKRQFNFSYINGSLMVLSIRMVSQYLYLKNKSALSISVSIGKMKYPGGKIDYYVKLLEKLIVVILVVSFT